MGGPEGPGGIAPTIKAVQPSATEVPKDVLSRATKVQATHVDVDTKLKSPTFTLYQPKNPKDEQAFIAADYVKVKGSAEPGEKVFEGYIKRSEKNAFATAYPKPEIEIKGASAYAEAKPPAIPKGKEVRPAWPGGGVTGREAIGRKVAGTVPTLTDTNRSELEARFNQAAPVDERLNQITTGGKTITNKEGFHIYARSRADAFTVEQEKGQIEEVTRLGKTLGYSVYKNESYLPNQVAYIFYKP
jgi:hypothetical protein